MGFIYNGVQYFYLTNQMGDVVVLSDPDGNIFAEYVYDAWGSLVTINTADENNAEQLALANANPLRYRGYYYDNETGYYYLQSRYYDPSICRFINADVAEIAQMTKDVTVGANLFAYCNNDPINYTDLTGQYGIKDLLDVLNKAIGVLESIVTLISNSCKKELNSLTNTVKKLAKSQRQHKKLLKEVIDQSDKLARKLGKVGKVVALVATVIGIAATIKTGAHITFVIAQILAEIVTEAISSAASTICSRIAKLVPGVGFILQILVSMGVSYMLSKYFTNSRISKIANRIYKNCKSLRSINKKNLFKATFKGAFAK